MLTKLIKIEAFNTALKNAQPNTGLNKNQWSVLMKKFGLNESFSVVPQNDDQLVGLEQFENWLAQTK